MNQIEWFFDEHKDDKEITSKDIEEFFYANNQFGNNPNSYYHFSRFLKIFLIENPQKSKNALKVYTINWVKYKDIHPDFNTKKK
jgi:hypothetical protein